MRKSRDGEDTQKRVLAAAQEQFAEHGFSGTSLAAISKQSGISEGLILYHFQSKRNLYQQVLETLAGQYTDALIQARDSAVSPLEMMKGTLSTSFNFWKQDSTYRRISLWAYLEGEKKFVEKEAKLTAGLVRSVVQLQQEGLLDDSISPPVLITMIIGPIHYWLRYREQFKEALNLPETLNELDEAFIDQLTGFIANLSQYKE